AVEVHGRDGLAVVHRADARGGAGGHGRGGGGPQRWAVGGTHARRSRPGAGRAHVPLPGGTEGAGTGQGRAAASGGRPGGRTHRVRFLILGTKGPVGPSYT